ncbi:MAG: metallophosphoesterase [Candidatus Gracilibacteria bacterium]|nr:metallophosphoesterase [Candidatus Gracilibacteria bacterium]
MNKPIYIISDLHIGNHGKRDNFNADSTRWDKLMSFLSFVRKNDGKLYILGDLFDLWQHNVSEVLCHPKNRLLIKKLGSMNCTYILGNHDIDLYGFIKSTSYFSRCKLFKHMTNTLVETPIKMNDYIYHLLLRHGHEYDKPNSVSYPGFARIACIGAGLLEDRYGISVFGKQTEGVILSITECIMHPINSLFGWITRKLIKTPRTSLGRARNIIKNASEFLCDYEISVFGHTHTPGIVSKGDGFIVNTGSWADTENNVVCIDETGICVCTWNGKELVPTINRLEKIKI